ncbi:MAG: hypothetical protein ACI32O_01845 [Enterococcus sp.]
MKKLKAVVLGAAFAAALGLGMGTNSVDASEVEGTSVGSQYHNKIIAISSMDVGMSGIFQGFVTWNTANDDVLMNLSMFAPSKTQEWAFFYTASDDTYQIMSGPISIDGWLRAGYLSAGPTDSNGNPNVSATGSFASQKWRVDKVGTQNGSDVAILKNVSTGKVLDLTSTNDLILYNQNGGSNQHFVMNVVRDA